MRNSSGVEVVAVGTLPPRQQPSDRGSVALTYGLERPASFRDQAATAKVSKGKTSGSTVLRAYPVGATTSIFAEAFRKRLASRPRDENRDYLDRDVLAGKLKSP
jgi:hypothetical protein